MNQVPPLGLGQHARGKVVRRMLEGQTPEQFPRGLELLELPRQFRLAGQSLLDDAARRIVQMASPYAAFPETIRRDTDVLEITRTWTFTNADRLRSD